MRSVLILLLLAVFTACSDKLSSSKYPGVKWEKYAGNEESIKQYLDKNKDTLDPIEGIYSISSENSEKIFLGLYTERNKTTDFARVAIVKENSTFSAQFIEVVIRGDDLPKYARTADFTRVQRSLVYLSRQFTPNGEDGNFTFEYDEKSGVLVGRKTDGPKTAELQYLKLYPVR